MPIRTCTAGEPLHPAAETRTPVCLDTGTCVQRAIRVTRMVNNVAEKIYQLPDGSTTTQGVEIECPPMVFVANCGGAAAPAPAGEDRYVTSVVRNGDNAVITRSDGVSWTIAVGSPAPVGIDVLEWGSNTRLGAFLP